MIRRSISVPLAVLLSLMLLQVQTFALGAGVPWGGTGKQSFLGTYSGVMLPSADTSYDLDGDSFDPFEPVDPANFVSANALGLFLVAVDGTGIANGEVLLFVEDLAYIGTMSGLADNRKGQIFTVVDTTSTVSFTDGDITYIEVAVGRMVASVFQANSRTAGGFGFGSQSLIGISQITESLGGSTINFAVDGLLQSGSTTIPTFDSGLTAGSGE